MYRPLTESEITQLTTQNCRCQDWTKVAVGDDFDPAFIVNANFSGEIRLGSFKSLHDVMGSVKHAGIYNASLHNCTIASDVYINNIRGHIANYVIEDGVYIEDVGVLAVTEKSTFGNGTTVSAINEAGGREIKIFESISSQFAVIYSLLRNRPQLIGRLDAMVAKYVDSIASDRGLIQSNARITGCARIVNVNIGASAILDCAAWLENGTVSSCPEHPAGIGAGVIAKDFIIHHGASVTGGAKLDKCFVGQGAIVGKGFSAENSLIFANSELLNGEACAVFAGPYTVSHHKSTLLLTAMYSFYNAGSGTNKSNHMYRLGPVHQGILERGCKTGSDSYILWPARAGAFTTITGKHTTHFDTTTMPFSYLISDGGKSVLAPGCAIRSCGTIRDVRKWAKRDRRKTPNKLDMIIFDGLSPYVVQNMVSGRSQLSNLKIASDKSSEQVSWNGLLLKYAAIDKGIEYYDLGIITYLASRLIEKLEGCNIKDIASLRAAITPKRSQGKGRWIDLAGLIMPEEIMSKIVNDIESSVISDITGVNNAFKAAFNDYAHYQWCYIVSRIEDYCSAALDRLGADDLVALLTEYKFAIERLNILILEDARKEFDDQMKISYGYDGEQSIRDDDFQSVRGSFESNEFCKTIRADITQGVREADKAIEMLKAIK